jgi:hypothetical protein
MPSTVNGTELSAQEFRDKLLIRYARQPPDLPALCDGCSCQFSLGHALECKVGGLVILRHNEINHELADLSSKALSPSAIRDEPLIHPDNRSLNGPRANPTEEPVQHIKSRSNDEDRRDLLVRGLWQRGTDCIIDVRVTNINNKSQRHQPPEKVLLKHEREKKSKYLRACLEQRRHFTPFVVSTDGQIGPEAEVLLKRLSALLADKWCKPYSEVCGHVNARMSIAIARATHICIRGSRISTGRISSKHRLFRTN